MRRMTGAGWGYRLCRFLGHVHEHLCSHCAGRSALRVEGPVGACQITGGGAVGDGFERPFADRVNVGVGELLGDAIGGLAVGEPTDVMYEMIEVVNAILPEDRPRYLMGVGTPVNILEGIERGVDMFDCVMPTRNGRNGQIFTSEGTINIRNKKWEDDFSPIDPEGTAFVDHVYTKAYLHHLTICQEMLGAQIASLHNIAFYLRLVTEARRHIGAGDFTPWKEQMVAKLGRRL